MTLSLLYFVGSGLEQVGLIETKDLKAMAQRICLRHFGIGADGLVILLPGEKSKGTDSGYLILMAAKPKCAVMPSVAWRRTFTAMVC